MFLASGKKTLCGQELVMISSCARTMPEQLAIANKIHVLIHFISNEYDHRDGKSFDENIEPRSLKLAALYSTDIAAGILPIRFHRRLEHLSRVRRLICVHSYLVG